MKHNKSRNGTYIRQDKYRRKELRMGETVGGGVQCQHSFVPATCYLTWFICLIYLVVKSVFGVKLSQITASSLFKNQQFRFYGAWNC